MEMDSPVYGEAVESAASAAAKPAEKAKPARSAGGLFAKKEPAAKEPKARKVEYIDVEEPKAKRGRPAGGGGANMNAKKVQNLLGAVCACGAIATRDKAYAMDADDIAYHKDTFQQIADGLNDLPSWFKTGISQGSGIAGAIAGLAMFAQLKQIRVQSGASYAQIEAAVRQATEGAAA